MSIELQIHAAERELKLKEEIVRLKAENATIRQNSIDEETFEILKEEIKKETAKEILQKIGEFTCEDDYIKIKDYMWFVHFCEQYGVEVEE